METLGPFKGMYRGLEGIYRDDAKENGSYYLGFLSGEGTVVACVKN